MHESRRGELAAGRETAIVLTCPWHVRDARAERLGAPLYVPPPDQGDPNPVSADQPLLEADPLRVG